MRAAALGSILVITVAACGSGEPPARDATREKSAPAPAPKPSAPAKPLTCEERVQPQLKKAKDARAKLDLYEKSCDGGCVEACDRGATLFLLSFATDSAKDSRYLWRDCELGSGVACALLGDRYKAGRGVDVDPNHALELYERACKQEVSLGCSGQARMLEWATSEADNVKKLEAHAAELNELHCKQGDPFYCTLLADAYKEGRGVSKDLRRAIQLYTAACRDGLTRACETEKSLGP